MACHAVGFHGSQGAEAGATDLDGQRPACLRNSKVSAGPGGLEQAGCMTRLSGYRGHWSLCCCGGRSTSGVTQQDVMGV